MSPLAIVLVSVVYSTLALCAARPLAGHLAWDFLKRKNETWGDNNYTRPDGDQWFGAWCLAILACFAWPLVIVPWWIGQHHVVGAEREARLTKREQKIEKLEKELGL